MVAKGDDLNAAVKTLIRTKVVGNDKLAEEFLTFLEDYNHRNSFYNNCSSQLVLAGDKIEANLFAEALKILKTVPNQSSCAAEKEEQIALAQAGIEQAFL